MPSENEWRRFLAEFHGSRTAVTERLLRRADASPYTWLAEPLRRTPGVVLDLACGSAPTRGEFGARGEPSAPRWAGVDSSAAELACAAAGGRRPLVLGDAAALPFADATVAAVCAAMCLQVVTPLDAVLDEVKRVLRPGAVIASLTPAGLGWSPSGMLDWARVLGSVGTLRLPWPNPEACDGAAGVLRSHGFTVLSDERRVFRLGMETSADASLLLESLYLPGVDDERLRSARRSLAASWVRPGRRLPLPLRRVVARAA
ncbi:SAM-dependent methyltransferase [Spinactinospora alkalitolerans]|uniref:SAM-dependent methyltransferase n=1 Tax=Spinactinospora alkalitolerans TaxID=687207 RepID=A0A852TW12_9ACTN|nr:class I SAM-dependent methyltransferase [Spinactinospora alkalitolerans]NYE48118.1 SAM-dependent methyltransferase [Spinactinospora alkalitolerans]